MFGINNIACSITCDFNTNNALVKLAETMTIPCKWILGTKTMTGSPFTYTPPTDHYIKIALGIILCVPAAMIGVLCVNLAASYDQNFRERFSRAEHQIAYNQIQSMVLEKQKNVNPSINSDSLQEIMGLVRLSGENFSTFTWLEKVKFYCWTYSLPKEIRDLLNTAGKNKQEMLDWYKKALDEAKCGNTEVADLPTLYRCMPIEIFKDFFEVNFLAHITDNNNINEARPSRIRARKQQQSVWLRKLLISCSKDEIKKEFIKNKLRQELSKQQSEISEILSDVISKDMQEKKTTLFSDYLSWIYEENAEIRSSILDGKFGKCLVALLPFDYSIIQKFLSGLSKKHLKFVLVNASREKNFVSGDPQTPKDLKKVSIFTGIFDYILDTRYHDIKVSDIEEAISDDDWILLFKIIGQKHLNRIPELIEAYRSRSSYDIEQYLGRILAFLEIEDAAIRDQFFRCLWLRESVKKYLGRILAILEIENAAMRYKIFRCLRPGEYAAITNYLLNDIELLEDVKNNSSIQTQPLEMKQLDRFSKLFELMRDLPLIFPSLFDIAAQKIAQNDLITDEELEKSVGKDIQLKVNEIRKSMKSIFCTYQIPKINSRVTNR